MTDFDMKVLDNFPGKAVRKDITTGLFNDDTIAVESGLNAGDEVITTWASGLKEGAKIAK